MAIEYIDKVRERAGVVKLKDYITENNGFFPKLWVSKFANNYTDFEMIPANKDNVLMHLRMAERLLELAFEGHRWLDWFVGDWLKSASNNVGVKNKVYV